MNDANSSRIARRAAIRKVAVGGAVAWTAPTLLSSRATALVEACTARCAPFDTSNVTVSISVEIEPCVDDGNPGNEPVFGTITQTGSTGAPCPCSPSVISILTPRPGVVEQLSPGPGNWDGTIPIVAVIDCVDETGEQIRRTCGALGDIGASGNCNSLGGNTYVDNTILLDCNPPRCT